MLNRASIVSKYLLWQVLNRYVSNNASQIGLIRRIRKSRAHLSNYCGKSILSRKCIVRRYISCMLAAALIIAQTGCGDALSGVSSAATGMAGISAAADSQPVTKESFYFDTICQITVYGMEERDDRSFSEAAQAAITDAFSLCSEYEKLLSKTVEGSDIWNINHAAGEPVSCDSRTIDLIQRGIYYGDLSDGVFDITIGKAEDLWNFHAEESPSSENVAADEDGMKETREAAADGDGTKEMEDTAAENGVSETLKTALPNADDLAEAVSHVDYTCIHVDEDAQTVQLTDPEAELDLGGIAKGYIADAVCREMEGAGVTSAIVSLGGNIECIGGKPGSMGFAGDNASYTDFTIGIEMPYSDRTEIVGASGLQNGTMVTSGVYERYITVDGRRYHHILDVGTGYPVDTDVLGVTIKGDFGTSADCDALSTTCLILGSEKGKALIESLDGYEALFIFQDESLVTTTGMKLQGGF